jgi:predicted transcriptional regulator
MTDFTIGERLLLHLYRYRSLDQNEIYNIPWELTQDGIATTLCISRAHASIELKKLKNKDRVVEYQAHVKGGKVKRYVYYLNPEGLKAAAEVQKKADDAGIDVKTLLDLKCQDPTMAFDSMTPEDKYALGCACAFRVPIPLTILKEHKRAIIPADASGMTVINKDVRERYLSAASSEDMRSWHSFAADEWLENRTELREYDEAFRTVERTYHLLKAGRKSEACRSISNNIYDLMYIDDRDFLDALLTVTNPPEKNLIDVLALTCDIAINVSDYKIARETAERMVDTVVFEGEENEEHGDAQGYAYLAEVYALRGMRDEAEKFIRLVQESNSALAKLILADILIDMKEYGSAADEIDKLTNIPRANEASVFRRFYTIAKLNLALREDGAADITVKGCVPEVPPTEEYIIKMLNKAFASAESRGKALVRSLAKSYGYRDLFR